MARLGAIKHLYFLERGSILLGAFLRYDDLSTSQIGLALQKDFTETLAASGDQFCPCNSTLHGSQCYDHSVNGLSEYACRTGFTIRLLSKYLVLNSFSYSHSTVERYEGYIEAGIGVS